MATLPDAPTPLTGPGAEQTGEHGSLPCGIPQGGPEILGDDCWCLAGPTAAGKSAVAIPLAEQLDAEIVSADSMAVYVGLDIGTAKPTPSQRARVPHHLLDIVPASAPFSVALWLEAATAAIADIRRRGRRILVTGGTPLYLKALRDGLDPVPEADPAARAGLAAEALAFGPAVLHARLAAVDPVAARRIHPADLRRIIRALEIAAAGGRAATGWSRDLPPPWAGRFLVLDRPRRLLARRIDRRVEKMFATGLVDEVRMALATGGLGPTAGQAAGYAECLDLLAGRCTPAEAVARTQQRTRQLAKRQRTWLRSFPEALWISA
jgi:tRNA dimethylallyltransferase